MHGPDGLGTACSALRPVVDAAAVISASVRLARKPRGAAWAVAPGLLPGGARGDLSDSLARSPGISPASSRAP